MSNSSYASTYIPPSTLTEMEAGVFRQLCSHLQDRSDSVQNMDLMTISGFCRNCLAKWLVVEARKISDSIANEEKCATSNNEQQKHLKRVLDAFGYDEAAEDVYGCTYPEWKKRYQKKSTEDQMKLFNESKSLHAKHDKDLLRARADFDRNAAIPPVLLSDDKKQPKAAPSSSALLSDVCCQDVDSIHPSPGTTSSSAGNSATVASSSSYTPPPPPAGGVKLNVGILTVSDRAAANQYASGDLSGPAVEGALKAFVNQVNSNSSSVSSGTIDCMIVQRGVVPDDADAIADTLTAWAKDDSKHNSTLCNLVFTTGGTGFAPRDVTPEATTRVLDRECQSLMSWVSTECATSGLQPRACLSRGTAGVCGGSMIVNLPGNPAGAAQVAGLLLPLLLWSVKDLQDS
eukprot:CAMPEP_0195542176 /NCGR_PEP_ID=MMETSP0794_2-20130614/51470_1 /TAXON_ID=515487 /ORGANISM="Stephanopyxis turris, Strain CCMP 815" /LENGTH=401 /DNA_ID=CAMNT_0040676305 /DNA_START=47 /DNA_END=1252 /DNA_ORIENTATION=-